MLDWFRKKFGRKTLPPMRTPEQELMAMFFDSLKESVPTPVTPEESAPDGIPDADVTTVRGRRPTAPTVEIPTMTTPVIRRVGRAPALTEDEKQAVRLLVSADHKVGRIAKLLGCSTMTVTRALRGYR